MYMDAIIADDEIKVKDLENDFDDISADESDEVFKYTIVPNALIRDATISPQCRWLIIYLISNEKGWKIKSQQLWKHTEGFIGRDGIRKILNEAILAGYIDRTPITRLVNGKHLRRYSYKVASTPKFKKSLQCPRFQGPENQGPELQGAEVQGSKEVLYKELLSKENITPPIPPQKEEMPAKAGEMEKDESSKKKREKSDFSPKVRDLGNQIINSLSRTKPDYVPPKNLSSLLTEVDFLMRIDKRDPQKAMDVLNWALADSFWADKMFKPNPAKYLREKFDQLEMKMNAKPSTKDRKFAPSSNDARSLAKMQEWEKSAL